MSTTLLSSIVTLLRTRLGDEGEFRTPVVPLGAVNGANTIFFVPLYPIADGYILYNGAAVVSSANYTLDQTTGKLVYSTAPAVGTSHYLEMSYYEYSFTRLVNFIKNGISALQEYWDKDWTYSGSGTAETIANSPTSEETTLVVAAAARERADYELNKALSAPPYVVVGGRTVNTNKIKSWQEEVKALTAEIGNKVRDLGLSSITSKDEEYGVQWETNP